MQDVRVCNVAMGLELIRFVNPLGYRRNLFSFREDTMSFGFLEIFGVKED